MRAFHLYIDASGAFDGFQPSAVCGLLVPDATPAWHRAMSAQLARIWAPFGAHVRAETLHSVAMWAISTTLPGQQPCPSDLQAARISLEQEAPGSWADALAAVERDETPAPALLRNLDMVLRRHPVGLRACGRRRAAWLRAMEGALGSVVGARPTGVAILGAGVTRAGGHHPGLDGPPALAAALVALLRRTHLLLGGGEPTTVSVVLSHRRGAPTDRAASPHHTLTALADASLPGLPWPGTVQLRSVAAPLRHPGHGPTGAGRVLADFAACRLGHLIRLDAPTSWPHLIEAASKRGLHHPCAQRDGARPLTIEPTSARLPAVPLPGVDWVGRPHDEILIALGLPPESTMSMRPPAWAQDQAAAWVASLDAHLAAL